LGLGRRCAYCGLRPFLSLAMMLSESRYHDKPPLRTTSHHAKKLFRRPVPTGRLSICPESTETALFTQPRPLTDIAFFLVLLGTIAWITARWGPHS
jgi:hypothetical protein